MKLSTLLLPTGEFVLVLSETPPEPPTGDWVQTLRKATGAAAILGTDQSVEIENAVFDEAARRRDEPEPAIPDQFRRTYTPRDRPNGDGPAASLDFTVGDWALDQDVLDKLTGGISFTPAGLVDTVAHPEARSTAQLEPELEEALRRPAELFEEPTPEFCAGNDVEVVGPDYWGDRVYVGHRGSIVENELNNTPPECEYVSVDGAPGKRFIPRTSLKHVEPERPEEPTPKTGDTVRIIGDPYWEHDIAAPPRDTIGKVIEEDVPELDKDVVLVEFEHPQRGGPLILAWYFPCAALEVVSNG